MSNRSERTPFDPARRVNIYVLEASHKTTFDVEAKRSGKTRGAYLGALLDLHAQLVARAGEGSRLALEVLREVGLDPK